MRMPHIYHLEPLSILLKLIWARRSIFPVENKNTIIWQGTVRDARSAQWIWIVLDISYAHIYWCPSSRIPLRSGKH